MTVYLLILITLNPGSGDVTAVANAATFADKANCEAAGERWDSAGRSFEHLCLPIKLELP